MNELAEKSEPDPGLNMTHALSGNGRGADLSVRPVRAHELDAAFGILDRVRVWLAQQGRRQRITDTTRETYLQWQASHANYAVIERAELVGIFSLPLERPVEWPSAGINEPVTWLRALAIDPAHRGKAIGVRAVTTALQIVAPQPVYLDCVSDFLPSYYESLGFETMAQQTRHYAGVERPFEITLMKHSNLNSS